MKIQKEIIIDSLVIECIDEIIEWYKEGKLHRDDVPTLEHANGNKVWFKECKYHRIIDIILKIIKSTNYYLQQLMIMMS